MNKVLSLLAMTALVSTLALTPAFAMETKMHGAKAQTCSEQQPCGKKECLNCAGMIKDGVKDGSMIKGSMKNDGRNSDFMEVDGVKRNGII